MSLAVPEPRSRVFPRGMGVVLEQRLPAVLPEDGKQEMLEQIRNERLSRVTPGREEPSLSL